MLTAERDLLRELDMMEQPWPKSWKPTQPGDTVCGVIERYTIAQGRFGPCRVCTVRQAHGGRVAFAGIPEGKSYKKFLVAVARPEPDVPEFTALGGEEETAVDDSASGEAEVFDPFADEDPFSGG